jgi:2-(1,2-epoxy-1,2-dihydrophenyl)acetyl-CoA isomerase
MKHGRVILETTGDVAVMTLNDPSVLNAFGLKLREDMAVAMDRVEASAARCLVITGAGRAFCSGANLNDPDRASRDRAAEADGKGKSDLESWYNPMFMRLRALPIPIVTAINGMAAGAGMPGVDWRYSHCRTIRVVLAGICAHRAGARLRVVVAFAPPDRHGAGDRAVAAR